jgi:hypothetical protein
MKKGYEQTYDWVVKLLQDCDFSASAERLNLTRIGDTIAVDFLGRVYTVSKDGVYLTEEKTVWTVKSEGYDYNVKSVLGYYVLSESDAEPGNDFCPLGHFSHGIFRDGLTKNPLGAVFGKDYRYFCRTAKKLGMAFEGEKASGQYVWRYSLLPKIPVKLVYYEGDDEFPTAIQILYDKTAIRFFKFEPLAVLHICFIQGLAAIGETQEVSL